MKYSLNARQDAEYLRKADEIKIQYRDIAIVPDLKEKYPAAALVVEVPPAQEWDIAKVKEAFILSKNTLTICIPEIKGYIVEGLKSNGIPFFYGYPITNDWELAAALKVGVSQVRIEAPLFFNQDRLKNLGVKVRVTANTASQGYLPFTGINGSWIRPEDVDLYENIDIIEFEDCDKDKEQALYRIYAEQHAWPGKLSTLISNIDHDCVNRMLPPDFTKARLNCGQRCTYGACSLCSRYAYLADPDLLKNYLSSIEEEN